MKNNVFRTIIRFITCSAWPVACCRLSVQDLIAACLHAKKLSKTRNRGNGASQIQTRNVRFIAKIGSLSKPLP